MRRSRILSHDAMPAIPGPFPHSLPLNPSQQLRAQLRTSPHFMVVRTDRPEVRFIPTTEEELAKWRKATYNALTRREIKDGSASASLQRTAPEIHGGEPSYLGKQLFRKGNNSFVVGLHPDALAYHFFHGSRGRAKGRFFF